METVERHVTLPAELDHAWELLTDPDDLAAWLGREVVLDPTPGAVGVVVDDDGTRRRLVVDEVEAGRRLAWRWWADGAEAPSRVEITLAPTDGGTEVRVVEQLLPTPTGGVDAQASARASDAWSYRLLHLEALLLVAAAVRGVTTPPDAEARAAAVFEALADPTRRAVLRDVAEQGPRTATELAAALPVTRQAIAKHLAVLRAAGLVAPARLGRETRFSATLAPLAEAGRWLDRTGQAWEGRLARLEARARSKGGRSEEG